MFAIYLKKNVFVFIDNNLKKNTEIKQKFLFFTLILSHKNC